MIERLEDQHGSFIHVLMKHDQFVLIDEMDWELFDSFRWFVERSKQTWYCIRRRAAGQPGTKHVRLHCEIVQPSEGMQVDHRDGNGLNNRRYNLRQATPLQNGRNRHQAAGLT